MNGTVEAAFKRVKKWIRSAESPAYLAKSILAWHQTPTAVDTPTPAQLHLGQNLRGELNLQVVKADVDWTQVQEWRKAQKLVNTEIYKRIIAATTARAESLCSDPWEVVRRRNFGFSKKTKIVRSEDVRYRLKSGEKLHSSMRIPRVMLMKEVAYYFFSGYKKCVGRAVDRRQSPARGQNNDIKLCTDHEPEPLRLEAESNRPSTKAGQQEGVEFPSISTAGQNHRVVRTHNQHPNTGNVEEEDQQRKRYFE